MVKPVDNDPGGKFPYGMINDRCPGDWPWTNHTTCERNNWKNLTWTSINWEPLRCATPSVAEPYDASAESLVRVNGGPMFVKRNDDVGVATQALRAQQAGAEAVVVVNVCNLADADSLDMGPGADGLSVTIPVYSVSSAQGEKLVAAIRSSDTPVKVDLEKLDGLMSSDVCLQNVWLCAAYGTSSGIGDIARASGEEVLGFGRCVAM